MPMKPFAALILGAGQGTRMNSDLPKVLHPIAHRPMIEHVLATVALLAPARTLVVVSPGMERRIAALAHAGEIVVQAKPRGTGDAVMAARGAFEGFDGDVLVLYGDTPLITADTIEALLRERRRVPEAAIVVAGMRVPTDNAYARLELGSEGSLEAIIEARDCTLAQRTIDFCNAGPMAIDGHHLFALLDTIGNDNAQGEYYLTSIVAAARHRGLTCRAIEASTEEMAGANDRAELAALEALMQERLRAAALAAGVGLIAPETVFLSADTRIGRDSIVGPYVVFGPGVTIGNNVEIGSFCHIAGATIADRSRVGPFARLRPGADLAENVHVGNFVEVKNTRIEAGAKANHMAYLGDASIGPRTNIGAGAVTCNYDGVEKHRTDIGGDVFIGTNSSLVAPVSIGDGASIGAGSVITEDVPPDAMAIGRARQVTKKGRAAAWRLEHLAKTGAKRREDER